MLKVLTAAQMREVDRLTTERYGIPSIILMENAAHAVVSAITEKLGGPVEGKLILILCGKGNNGGDGAAAARLLWQAGALVTVELFGRITDTQGDAKTNFEIIKGIAGSEVSGGGLWFRERTPSGEAGDDWLDRSNFDYFDVLVDALFGTGLSGSLQGYFAHQAETVGRLKRAGGKPLVVAIDIPSGLSSDSGELLGENVDAHLTVTFTAPKRGNVVAPASGHSGELIIAAIGSPPCLIDEQPSRLFLAEKVDAADWLQRSEFSNSSYKNKRGHALIVAGSENYSGAAVLAGNAAIRSGVGLVTIATPRSSKDGIVSRVAAEVMVRPVAETETAAVSDDAIPEVEEFLKNVDAIAIGSGLSANDESTAAFVRYFLENRHVPTLLDADALTLVSPFVHECREHLEHPVNAPLILTPHEGEFRKLLGVEKPEADEILKDRVAAVHEFATSRNVILVLKGERVLIGEPGGKVVVNPTGNSGLGKAGNGDTLTGLLAGFLAQAAQIEIDIFKTVVAACYFAGLAGDIAEKKYGKRVMTASDVRDCFVEAFETLEKSPNSYKP